MNKLASLLFCLVVTIAAGGFAFSQDSASGGDPAKMEIKEINFDKAQLKTVVEFLRQKAKDLDPNGKGINIVVGDSVKTLPVTLNLDDMSILQILKVIAEENNLTLDIQPYAYILDSVSGSNGGGAQAAGGPLSIPISVDLHDVSLDQAIAFIGSESKRLDSTGKGVNIVINPDVDSTKKITLSLNNTPVQDVLHYVTQLSGTTLGVQDGIVYIKRQ